MNKSNIVFIILVIIGFGLGFAHAFNEPDELTLNDNNLANSMVWEITGPGIDKPSYLAGTIHIICAKDFKLNDRFLTAINNTEKLYLEFDVDDPSEMSQMFKGMVSKVSLKERLSTAQYQQLDVAIQKQTNFNIRIFDKIEFFAIQSALIEGSLGCPTKSYEIELMEMAQSKQKSIYGLETVKEQLAAVKALNPIKKDGPWTEQEMSLFIGSDESFNQLLTLYLKEDITGLYEMINKQMTDSDLGVHMKKTLLDHRNTEWVKKIPKIIKSEPTFFAVGAGHLAGEHGVINLLRQSGYTVKPIMD